MTANELADKLDLVRIELTIQAATMLRQQQAEIEALKERLEETRQLYIKQLALQRLSDIGQAIEQTELQALVKSFFEDYLDYQEESDSNQVFNPIHVSCTRVMMTEPMAKLLMRMRELSGAKE
jgi:hypothetical protein